MRLAVLILALASGCTTARPDAAPVLPAAGEPVVTLERTVCYGTCPAYTVAAYADGRVVFEGREHVARAGTSEWRVAPATVAGLVRQAEQAGHARFPEHLTGPDVCTEEMTDNSTATTTVRTAAGTSRVSDYHGCMGFERRDALVAFEDAIDRDLGTASRVGGSDPAGGR